ncbi:MAG: hypothetical protein KC457_03400 [Myxococcales bacterium]|nr:hypothetical protein [Myxococcales bacterium]
MSKVPSTLVPGAPESAPPSSSASGVRRALGTVIGDFHGEHREPGEVIISFRHVHKAFGNNVVYRDMNLDVRLGETLTVTGGSGQGKSDDEVCDEMMRACDDLIDRARNHGSNLVPVQTRRQLDRYVNWMWSEELIEHQRQQNTVRKIPARGENTIVGLAQKLIERLDRV